ncbi:MAG: hypothetical protein K2K91_08270 [Ruminococcus sp.]|nr:hypothetical protein [Ruminococcus sp.]
MKIEVMNGYIMEAKSFIITWDWMRDKLHLRKGALRDTYALIYSYTHNNADAWFTLGKAEIEKCTDSTRNTVKTSLDLLTKAGFIIEKEVPVDFNKTHRYYRINEQVLIERGIWKKQEQENNIPNYNYNLPESSTGKNFNHNVDFTPSEPESVHEPIQIYGEYKNVRLTEMEYKQLQEKFPDTFEYTLKRFSETTFTKGYKWGSSSYFTVLSEWCSEDAEKMKCQTEPTFAHEPIHNYGKYMNVRLTETEYKQLQEKFPDTFEYTLRRFSDKVHSKGYKWSSHSYFTVLSEWCSEDAEKARKKAEKQPCQNLTKNFSATDTGNIYNTTNNFALKSSPHSQMHKEKKKISFNDILSEIGSNLTADSESQFSLMSPDMRNTENCTLPYNFNRSEMTEALKFISSFSYYQKQDPESSFVLESEAVIELLAEIMVNGYNYKNSHDIYIYYSGTEIIDKVNPIIHGKFFNDGMHDFINEFLNHYGKSVTENKINGIPIYNQTAYMKKLIFDFVIHYKARLASDLAGLDYELKEYGSPVSHEEYGSPISYGKNKKSNKLAAFGGFNTENYTNYINCL